MKKKNKEAKEERKRLALEKMRQKQEKVEQK